MHQNVVSNAGIIVVVRRPYNSEFCVFFARSVYHERIMGRYIFPSARVVHEILPTVLSFKQCFIISLDFTVYIFRM